jgi:hypothetical protein
MPQSRERLHFPLETLGSFRILPVESLDGYLPAHPHIVGAPHASHPARTDADLKFIAIPQHLDSWVGRFTAVHTEILY